jgi:imidazolonepropionase-like amidohydrolase
VRHLYLLLISLSLSATAYSQSIYLVADRMIDVVEEESILNPVIQISGGLITAIGTSENTQIPAGAEIIDLSGHTLMPGMIDMHVHLNNDAEVHGYRRLERSTARRAITGVKNARATLLAGVTTVRNLGANWGGHEDIALRDAINEGDVIGPRIFAAGPSLGITGGHCDLNLLPQEHDLAGVGVADGPWAVRQQVRENLKFGADVIKFCATGGVLSKGTEVGVQQYTLEEMEALVDEAHRFGIVVAAHAHGTSGINDAIRAGVDSIEHASFIDDEGIRMARRNGTYLSMDIYVTEYILSEGEAAGILQESLDKERTVGAVQRENFTKAYEAGVNMVMGTDAGVYPHGDNLKQLSRMVQFGMEPMEAFQAASINAATLLKQQDSFGSIQVGLSADIIAVSGNPLEDITLMEAVNFVMKEGEIYKAP